MASHMSLSLVLASFVAIGAQGSISATQSPPLSRVVGAIEDVGGDGIEANAHPFLLAQQPEGTGDAEPTEAPPLAEGSDQQGEAGEVEGAGPVDPSLEEIVSRLQAFYNNITAYHADFEQVYTNLALGDSQVSSGHMFFLRPGRMRWDYHAPQEKYLISDGEVLWMYEPEFNQVARLDLSTTNLPSALRFLMGEGVLVDDFEISACETEVEGMHCVHLVSRTGEGDYQYLEFLVDVADYSVRQTRVLDPVGNLNTFIFSHASTTDPLPVEGFQFTPPADARIVTPDVD